MKVDERVHCLFLFPKMADANHQFDIINKPNVCRLAVCLEATFRLLVASRLARLLAESWA